jgi:hypothetical protein
MEQDLFFLCCTLSIFFQLSSFFLKLDDDGKKTVNNMMFDIERPTSARNSTAIHF